LERKKHTTGGDKGKRGGKDFKTPPNQGRGKTGGPNRGKKKRLAGGKEQGDENSA